MENLELLVNELRQYETETNWFEFKHNNYDHEMIGKDISALANSAAYSDRNCAYMIWGINDKTHEIVGTDKNQYTLKIGNQEIESWLKNTLSKNADFDFYPLTITDSNNIEKNIVVLVIRKAQFQTVTFKKESYIRVGSYTKPLNEYPQMQAVLWDKIRNNNFEQQYALQNLTIDEVIRLLDISIYFDILNLPLPSEKEGFIHFLQEEKIIIRQDDGLFAITNLGAILFAKKLSDFDRLERKALRIVQYQGKNKLNMVREEISMQGYVVGFVEKLKYIEALLPTKEEIIDGLRKTNCDYPLITLREAIANALIHQDFSITGTGVVVEIFSDRIEITNPGVPLIDVNRIIDNPPKSRNEKLASLMRRLKMCEELGSGWDKMIVECELNKLPAPEISVYEENTKVVIYSKKDFFDMTQEEKLWACYMHACIQYVQGEFLTNSSLRERFGLEEKSSASVSRLIKDACDTKKRKPFIKKLEDTAPRYIKYIPWWA